MLRLNFERIFIARGVYKPFSYLKRMGFSANYASKIKNNRVKRMDLREMEKLCIALHCTPNDFYEWIPESDDVIDDKHPLNNLKLDKIVNITKALNAVPLDRLDAVESFIKDLTAPDTQ